MGKRNWNIWIWPVVALIDIVLVMLVNSTYDSGDSVLHYLYAKQAFDYPKYFMDSWAKPVFVLLASPFAYWGWAGMKLFNALCILGSSYFTYRLFKSYHFNGWLALILSFAAPHFFLAQASGLTEPLFTLFLIAIIYFLRIEKYVVALVLLSFLSFVRAEGWVVTPIVLFYIVLVRKVQYTPYVLVGTIVYGIVGLAYYNDFLWMFHQNPYSGVEEKYGSGNWLHFVNQLPYVIGFPLYILVYVGVFDGVKRVLQGQMDRFELIMVYGMTVGYFFAHSAFWALGLFHSFGLNRVLIVTIPLLAFISARGLDRLTCAFGFIPPKWVRYVTLAAVVLFPFTGNKAALNLPDSVQKEPLQVMIDEVKEFTDSTYGNHLIYYGNWYIPMVYDKDFDDDQEARGIDRLKAEIAEPGSIVIWDSYFSVVDKEVTSEFVRSRTELKLVKSFKCTDCRNPYTVEVYVAM